MNNITRAVEAIADLDGDNARSSAVTRTYVGEDGEYAYHLINGLLGLADHLVTDLAVARGTTRETILDEWRQQATLVDMEGEFEDD